MSIKSIKSMDSERSDDAPYPLKNVVYYIDNNTVYPIKLKGSQLLAGNWEKNPTSFTQPDAKARFESSVGTFTGQTQGSVEYSIGDGSFYMYWDLYKGSEPFFDDVEAHGNTPFAVNVYHVPSSPMTQIIVT